MNSIEPATEAEVPLNASPNDSVASGRPLVGLLQCGESPPEIAAEHGDYDAFFRRFLGDERFRFRTWRALDGTLPDSVDEADAWLLTGSRFGVYEPHAWIAPLEDFVRAVHAAGVPLVGICFGHQLVAQALGGRAEKFSGGWSIGRVDYRISAEPEASSALEGIDGESLPLLAFHQDQVVEPPPGARTLASSDFCRHAAFAIGERTFTLQPHPEFPADFVDSLLRVRAEAFAFGDDYVASVRETLAAPLANERMAAAIGRFLLAGIDARRAERAGSGA